MLADIPFLEIDPVTIDHGPLSLRWYGLAYLAAFRVGFVLLRWAARRWTLRLVPAAAADMVMWLIFGVLVGRRR